MEIEIQVTSVRFDGGSQGGRRDCPWTMRGVEKGLWVELRVQPTQLSDREGNGTRWIELGIVVKKQIRPQRL